MPLGQTVRGDLRSWSVRPLHNGNCAAARPAPLSVRTAYHWGITCPLLGAHLKSLQEYPPSQGADTLSMKKAIEKAMQAMENPHGSSN